jgi:AAA domain
LKKKQLKIMPNNTEDWKPISAAELVETPVERFTPKLTMDEFQRFMTEMLDGWFWDRLSDEELLDKLEGYARTYKKKVTREQFQNLIDARRCAHENSGIELPVPVMPEREDLPPYIVPRRDKNYAGWFPRGTVSLIAGSSGMGKTTMLLYLLEDLRAGRSILNHPPAKAEYCMGLVDRTIKALEESLEDKGLDTQAILARSVKISHADGDAAKVLNRQLRRWKRENSEQPDVVVLEGIDFWVRKINDFDAVYSLY